jgi:hypothetical protein
VTRLLVGMRFAPYSATPALAVRNAVDIAEVDAVYRESYGPDSVHRQIEGCRRRRRASHSSHPGGVVHARRDS